MWYHHPVPPTIPTLDIVREKLKNWDGCPLRKTCTQAVLGEGNAKAEVMFIGEAPGEQEDKQGRPFVGPAGKFLDELLGTIGFERKDVYISNVVKYRPPNNRDPTPEEKAQCLPWLMMEIALIKPKVLVPLGRHALTSFFSKLNITAAHGKPQSVRMGEGAAMTVFPIYHPAAALHNPGLRDALYSDFRALGEFLKKSDSLVVNGA
jgi:DNA polymerase